MQTPTVSSANPLKDKLKVTLVGSLPPIKGVSPYTSHLLRALAADQTLDLEFVGFRSIYPRRFYPGGEPVDPSVIRGEYPGVKVRNVLAWYNPLSWVWAGLTLNGDVVHAQWWSYILAPVYATVLAIARLRGKRVVVTVHNVDPHERVWWKKALNRAIYSFGQRFIVHSEPNRESLGRLYGRSANAVSVVPHGILTAGPLKGLSPAEARAKLEIPAEAPVALCFGNIRPYKGVEVLLQAWPEVLKACPPARLVVAGKPWTEWEPFQRLIDGLGIASSLHLFLDFVPADRLEEFFAAADVVVLPYSQFDAQSGVGTLALFFAKPMVVTSVGGLPELVQDAQAVIPPDDAGALASAIAKILTDERLRGKLAADAAEVAARFSWEPIAAQTVEVYRTLVSAGATPAGGTEPFEGGDVGAT
ncbi:MAG: glycosyltransferase [Chloroflexi bacterium]|nr:glycosyltransferase [Chloroflexota bacterium]